MHIAHSCTCTTSYSKRQPVPRTRFSMSQFYINCMTHGSVRILFHENSYGWNNIKSKEFVIAQAVYFWDFFSWKLENSNKKKKLFNLLCKELCYLNSIAFRTYVVQGAAFAKMLRGVCLLINGQCVGRRGSHQIKCNKRSVSTCFPFFLIFHSIFGKWCLVFLRIYLPYEIRICAHFREVNFLA